MSLRGQLLALLLVTLLLPWAGCQTVRELEEALRAGQAQTLRDAALAIAGVIATQLDADTTVDPPEARGEAFFVHTLARAPEIDGFDADWPLEEEARQRLPDGISWVRAGRSERHLFLFVSVVDDTVLPLRRSGGEPEPFDRVVVKTAGEDAARARRWLFAAEAPGAFTPLEADERWRPAGPLAPTVLAHWQPRRDGYQVEIRIPLGLVGERLGVGFIDIDEPGGAAREVLSWSPGFLPGRIIGPRAELAARLAALLPEGIRAELLDPAGWRLAAAGAVVPVAGPDPDAPLLAAMRDRWFTWWLEGAAPPRPRDPLEAVARTAGQEVAAALAGRPGAARYRGDEGTLLAVAVPLTAGGALLLEQGSAEIVTLGNRALTRVLSLALAFAGLLAVLLLGYASWLSWRVRRLSRAAGAALGPRGELGGTLPGNASRDELGELARSFETLLARIAGYTGYLQTLGGKLSHELKTPLAIVGSSLDNLEAGAPAAAQQPYLERAREGTARLGRILAALSEATQVEDMVRHSPRERYAPGPVIQSCVGAYRELHPEFAWTASLASGPGLLDGSPELLSQALDKLVDNAVSLAPKGSTIEVAQQATGGRWHVSVSNTGSALPAGAAERLFDSLVSERRQRGSEPHLGLGLFVVRLVAEFHGGSARAENLRDGVRVTLDLPAHAPR